MLLALSLQRRRSASRCAVEASVHARKVRQAREERPDELRARPGIGALVFLKDKGLLHRLDFLSSVSGGGTLT